MMIENASSFSPKSSDHIFFDTNVLLDLFAPGNLNSDPVRVAIYADLLRRALSAKAHLFILSHNISEFYNRLIKFDFNLSKRKKANLDFKRDYRPSRQHAANSARYISIINTQILKNFELRNDDAATLFTKHTLCYYNTFDFNDFLFSAYSNLNSTYVVTHDADFKSAPHDICILTANKSLLPTL